MAAAMPELKTIRRNGVVMTGEQMIKEGIKEVNGEEINPASIYKGMKSEVVPMNHEKNMKKLYYQHGAKGVRAYIQNVENHANELQPDSK